MSDETPLVVQILQEGRGGAPSMAAQLGGVEDQLWGLAGELSAIICPRDDRGVPRNLLGALVQAVDRLARALEASQTQRTEILGPIPEVVAPETRVSVTTTVSLSYSAR